MTNDAVVATFHTPFRGNDETRWLADSQLMAPRTFLTAETHLPQWLHRLHVQLRWVRAEARQMNRLPLLRLTGAVLVALLALATASGLIAPT